MARCTFYLLFCLVVLQISASKSKKEDTGTEESEKWKKKDVRDYNDADVERLFEQWEVRIIFVAFVLCISSLRVTLFVP